MMTASLIKINSLALSKQRNDNLHGNFGLKRSATARFVGSTSTLPECFLKCSSSSNSTGKSITSVTQSIPNQTSVLKILKWLKIPALLMVVLPSLLMTNVYGRKSRFTSVSDVILGVYITRSLPSLPQPQTPPSPSSESKARLLRQVLNTMSGTGIVLICIAAITKNLVPKPISIIKLQVSFRERYLRRTFSRVVEISSLSRERQMLKDTTQLLLDNIVFLTSAKSYIEEKDTIKDMDLDECLQQLSVDDEEKVNLSNGKEETTVIRKLEQELVKVTITLLVVLEGSYPEVCSMNDLYGIIKALKRLKGVDSTSKILALKVLSTPPLEL